MSRPTSAEGRKETIVDPLRPRFHFLPPSQWMNDPNGLVHWRGTYHLFYQYNPNRPVWGDIHWGHATSRDLVHWQDRPPALSPHAEPTDLDGCWTGCAVKDGERVAFLYTGTENGVQRTCLAHADPDLTRVEKYPGNPIVTMPEDLPISFGAFRDPFIWRQDEKWYQVIGSSLDRQGRALLYRSDDLVAWEYLHPLIEDDVRSRFPDAGLIWECPNFLALGDRHVLIVGRWVSETLTGAVALLGSYRGERFYPERMVPFDHGERCHYATQVFQDEQGRWLAFGWLQEQRPEQAQIDAGWSGVMSLPRILTQRHGRLHQRFAPELEALRGRPTRLESRKLSGTHSLGTFGNALELQARFRADPTATLRFRLRHSEREETVVLLDWRSRKVVVDRSRSSVAEADKSAVVGDLATEEVDLHLYLDGSVVEMIVDGREALTGRIYPTHAGEVQLELSAEGGVEIVSLGCWPMSSIWDARAH